MRLHPEITRERLERGLWIQSVVEEYFPPAYCNHCGKKHDNMPEDTHKGKCDDCGCKAVYGSAYLMKYLGEIKNKKRKPRQVKIHIRRPAQSYQAWYRENYGK